MGAFSQGINCIFPRMLSILLIILHIAANGKGKRAAQVSSSGYKTGGNKLISLCNDLPIRLKTLIIVEVPPGRRAPFLKYHKNLKQNAILGFVFLHSRKKATYAS